MAQSNNRRPGQQRRSPYGTGTSASENRLMWVRLEGQEIVLYDAAENEVNSEPGQDITIMFAKTNRRPFSVRLTSWTTEELDAAEALVREAFHRARETVQLRDKTAGEVYEQGGMPFKRLYRRPPVLVGRPGEVFQHGQELFGRPTNIPGVVGPGRSVGPVGVFSPGVAQPVQEDSSAQDDTAQGDEPEVFLDVPDEAQPYADAYDSVPVGLQVSDGGANDPSPNSGGGPSDSEVVASLTEPRGDMLDLANRLIGPTD